MNSTTLNASYQGMAINVESCDRILRLASEREPISAFVGRDK